MRRGRQPRAVVDAASERADNARMIPRVLTSLKGRDLRALSGFKERIRSSLGKRLLGVKLLGRRPLDVPPEAALPPPPRAPEGAPAKGNLALRPVPEAPGALEVAVTVERRDLWIEDQVDAAALDTTLETGALVAPFLLAADELATESAANSPFGRRLAAAEELP